MVGGAPISAPPFVPNQTFPGQPIQAFPNQTLPNQLPGSATTWQGNPQPVQQRMPPPAALAGGNAVAGAPLAPKIRMQAPDAPAQATRLVLPSPEELGVAKASPRAPAPPVQPPVAPRFDWNDAHARLQGLGAIGFHMDRLEQGGFRVTFLLPTRDAQRTQHIEAEAATEAAAVQSALNMAESCMQR